MLEVILSSLSTSLESDFQASLYMFRAGIKSLLAMKLHCKRKWHLGKFAKPNLRHQKESGVTWCPAWGVDDQLDLQQMPSSQTFYSWNIVLLSPKLKVIIIRCYLCWWQTYKWYTNLTSCLSTVDRNSSSVSYIHQQEMTPTAHLKYIFICTYFLVKRINHTYRN